MFKIVPIEKAKPLCLHPAHHPPAHIVIPAGHKLVHTCPHCGDTTTIYNNELNNEA